MSQFDFKELEPNQSAEYEFSDMKTSPTLTVIHAGQENKGYFNAVLKMNKLTPQQLRKLKNKSMQMVQQDREQDLTLYPQFIVKWWVNVKNTAGVAVPFTKENCEEFLRALPHWLFTEFKGFCNDPTNFLEVSDVDAEEVAKNSEPG